MQTTSPTYQFFSGSGDTYTVQLPPGEARTDYDLYAVYTKSDGKKVLAGKLRVRTESPKTYPVTLVAMEGVTLPNASDVKTALDAIYKPFAISWDVKVIDGTVINATSWDYNANGKIDASDQDEFLSEYSEEQNALHATFVGTVGKEIDRSVVFLFKSEVGGSFVKDGAKLGDMPINRRWGYLFGGAPDARTLAHELQARSVRPSFQESTMLNRDELKADGRTNPDERSDIGSRLTLRHTFATEHCKCEPGHTNNHNLMDYGSGTGLNRFQWETAHNPAPIGKVFQDDEDGAARLDVSEDNPDGYAGANEVFDHLFQNRDEIYSIIQAEGIVKLNSDMAKNVLEIFYKYNVNILNNLEAYGYIEKLYEFEAFESIADNKDLIISLIESGESDLNIWNNISGNLDVVVDYTSDFLTETTKNIAGVREAYNITKEIPMSKLRFLLTSRLNARGISNLLVNMSNSQFKNILRSNGITIHKDIQELVQLKNVKSPTFYVDSRLISLINSLSENEIISIINKSSDLSVVDVSLRSNNLILPIPDRAVNLKNLSSTLEIAGYWIDLAIALRNVSNGAAIEPADLLFFIPGAPDLVKHIVNNMISVEQILWNKELPWAVIKSWNMEYKHQNQTGQEWMGVEGDLYLQYTIHEVKYNPFIYPTSFVFENEELAIEVFGFKPEFVNYNNDEGVKENVFSPVAQSNKIVW